MKSVIRIAPDIGWLPISFTNVYFVGRPGAKWVLVDAGLPGWAGEIMDAAEARFGAGERPEGILLTHGHSDHVGSAQVLAEQWDVPIYAHRLELPYLTGKSVYPPSDPTAGGAIAFLSRFLPGQRNDVGKRVHELPTGSVPGLTGWQWIHTPGHSPGHVSFFRASDRVLLAGDALCTMDMDSWSGLITGKQRLSRPPAPTTCDWSAAHASVRQFAGLRPNVVGCGHGIPITDADLPNRIARFAAMFRPPRHGRYVRRPAVTDENGLVDLPPAPFDPVPLATVASLILMGVAVGAGYLDEKRRK